MLSTPLLISTLEPYLVRSVLNHFGLTKEEKHFFSFLNHLFIIWVSVVKGWLEIIKNLVRNLKNQLLKSVMGYFPKRHADLINGMVFGERLTQDRELESSLKVIGMQHVVSASGFNVSLMLSICNPYLNRFPAILKALCLVGVALFYGFLANFSPSVVRAVIMVMVSVVGSLCFHRQYHPLRALWFTAGIMLVCNHQYATNVSFQLSFLATLGIIKAAPLLSASQGWFNQLETGNVALHSVEKQFFSNSSNQKNWFTKRWNQIGEAFKDAFVTTLAAQAFTLPLSLVLFGEVSLLSFVANPLLLWLTPLITSGGVGFMVVATVLKFFPGGWYLSTLSSWPLYLVTSLFVEGVLYLGQFTHFLIKVPSVSWWLAWCWWGLLWLGLQLKEQGFLRERRRIRPTFFEL